MIDYVLFLSFSLLCEPSLRSRKGCVSSGLNAQIAPRPLSFSGASVNFHEYRVSTKFSIRGVIFLIKSNLFQSNNYMIHLTVIINLNLIKFLHLSYQ